ncbi:MULTISPECIES: type II toxin-antitoxin system YafQ family toxin [Campylobacter]|uniref:type II toxin-antitoxin system YafQ family toxin n=1 Tax=Campylobacter TaxID=194 RepID=UPI00069B1595|nr:MULTISPECIES: type II toxin-antitoxin system YafQ family toxin [Campylobacter]MBO5063725.1 type II toxin-antitoxin system YafQ family toxin [Campylobacter sp.]MBP3675052.1 type II toxin-antitoxin system YafQ family toxin [Campylobacter sp.]MBQ8820217.1 type II toxin-antitoxin system YafQ family toxin [Campylobacter sp.]MBR2148297.1 type II toxin-antitoxin system YafQ family toxin [Campylobacter sp.]MBR2222365.1 type II toxin-antitoxin system YafQ family toxin [Campylobacter sp.]
MKYNIKYATKFKKHYKRLNAKDQQEARAVINRLANDEILEIKYRDHALQGDLIGFRECHLKPDLLLIYQKQNRELILYCFDIGSHSELF